jgi:hypothetical protein
LRCRGAIVEEAGKRGPTLEDVLDGFAGLAILGNPDALLAQPSLNAMMSGRLCSVRMPTRCCATKLLISRSMANNASMCTTASLAIGALLIRPRSKNLRRA